MSYMRMAVVHLDNRTVEVVTPDGDLAWESVGAAFNLALIERYGADSLVFGGGPLTGTFAPASALLVGSFAKGAAAKPAQAAQSAQSTPIRHVPLLLTAGSDFRFSGIDHLVLLGDAERPTLLHIDGGRVRFVDLPKQAADLPSLGTSLRRFAPPFRSTILTGPAADAGVPFAAVSLGAKGSLDKAGLAGAMAVKNLKGILLGGSGGIAFAAEDLRRSLELVEKIKRQQKKAGGFTSLVEEAGGRDCLKALKGATLHDTACFHCPAPCMVHAEFAETDPRLPGGPKKKGGVLLLDHMGWIALAKKRGGQSLPLLREALRLGLDPSAAASFLPREGTPASDLDALSALAQGGPALSPSTASPTTDLTFGGGLSPIGTGEEARRITALAFVLGVCPLFLQRFPQVAEALPAFLPADVTPASLDRTADNLLA